MIHKFSLLFFVIFVTFDLSIAQVTLTEITDPVLTDPNTIIHGATSNAEGQTILYGGAHIYTYTNELIADYECHYCYDIYDVVTYRDTQYIAESNGPVYKRFGDSIALAVNLDATQLAIDKNGILYGNDYGNGFFRWDGVNQEIWNEDNSNLPSNYVYDLAIDSNGIVWLATDEGLVSFNGTSLSIKSVPDELSSTFYNVEVDQDNTVWVGSAYGGVGRFANNTWTTFLQFGLLQLVQNVGLLHGTEIWTASFDKGLYRYYNNQFFRYAPSYFGFSEFDNCSFLSGDVQGRLWMQFDNTPLMYLTTRPTSTHQVEDTPMQFQLSPNPSSGIIYLSTIDDLPGLKSIQVFTSEGIECYNQNVVDHERVTLDMTQFSSGLYLAVISDASGHRETHKFILR